MGDWAASRAKARLDRREVLDELVARVRFEVRLHLEEPAEMSRYDDLAEVFSLGHGECAALLMHRRVLPWWERRLLGRFARRLHGAVIAGSVADVPAGAGSEAPRAFRAEIARLTPDAGDTGARYDLQGRGLLTVFRLSVGVRGAAWPDRHEVATTSARNILTCSDAFLRRSWWQVVWPVYRVRGLRLWRL
ncbi:hypothetical protein [Amycolatopsis jiangsuensis]|uniref:Uncharacterized protein n=1 Tax=Amycolatopsis jiangsuensis TaxID=1181879 RepID=A0A840J342_9PSEU|nr:hypothetical protein [Amycolatopsis jiangsuensis]MBB4687877.1 hypothetical protein [Amycolatopsis jiangsuensis]